MEINYEKYYNLEEYLFNDVQKRFHHQHYLSAFDFFCILLWKANRVKGQHAKRLLLLENEDNLEEISKRITKAIYCAKEPKGKLFILFKTYKFLLPTASAILSVLYPDTFSVYDYRVCSQLKKDFKGLAYKTNFDNIWNGYQEYLADVKSESAKSNYREADKYLWGKSFCKQLKKDIKNNFKLDGQVDNE